MQEKIEALAAVTEAMKQVHAAWIIWNAAVEELKRARLELQKLSDEHGTG